MIAADLFARQPQRLLGERAGLGVAALFAQGASQIVERRREGGCVTPRTFRLIASDWRNMGSAPAGSPLSRRISPRLFQLVATFG